MLIENNTKSPHTSHLAPDDVGEGNTVQRAIPVGALYIRRPVIEGDEEPECTWGGKVCSCGGCRASRMLGATAVFNAKQ